MLRHTISRSSSRMSTAPKGPPSLPDSPMRHECVVHDILCKISIGDDTDGRSEGGRRVPVIELAQCLALSTSDAFREGFVVPRGGCVAAERSSPGAIVRDGLHLLSIPGWFWRTRRPTLRDRCRQGRVSMSAAVFIGALGCAIFLGLASSNTQTGWRRCRSQARSRRSSPGDRPLAIESRTQGSAGIWAFRAATRIVPPNYKMEFASRHRLRFLTAQVS